MSKGTWQGKRSGGPGTAVGEDMNSLPEPDMGAGPSVEDSALSFCKLSDVGPGLGRDPGALALVLLFSEDPAKALLPSQSLSAPAPGAWALQGLVAPPTACSPQCSPGAGQCCR